jgi:uncharacterized protein YihD (DUF1040 family)
MRDPARIEKICELLAEAWHRHPDLRLCQFLRSLLPTDQSMFGVEDDLMSWLLADACQTPGSYISAADAASYGYERDKEGRIV